MKFTFANNALAAAFFAAVYSQREVMDHLDPCDLGQEGRTTLDVYLEEEDCGIYIYRDEDDAESIKVSTAAELEQAIGEAIALKYEQAEPRLDERIHAAEDDDDANPLPYDAFICSKGTVKVGCKNFTEKGAAQVIAAARKAIAGKEVKPFETDGVLGNSTRPSTTHSVEVDGTCIIIDEDTDNSAEAEDIIRLADLRAKLLKRGKKPAARKLAKPFRIFPAPKARKKKR